MTTPADELTAAADKLRALATNATPGPWRQHDTHLGQYGHTATVLSGERNTTELRAWLPSMSHEPWDEARNVWADAAYIAVMHPGVGEALAKWLEAAAVDAVQIGPSPHALTVARRINAAA
ncbi:hypothetical protein ACFYQA_08445 [Streptomyces sp. NPDC005774]|uniref:hypothetical protein n=1 Tax=Streptomyces sp. NPDC005774 TaxID=3364728 RepID=UPI0036C521EA